MVELKLGAIPVSQRQYYIPRKPQIEIQKHLDRLLKNVGSFGLVSLPKTLPYCLPKNQGLKTLGQSRTSMQSAQQLSLYMLWSETRNTFGPYPS
jgi:hypothetical protein